MNILRRVYTIIIEIIRFSNSIRITFFYFKVDKRSSSVESIHIYTVVKENGHVAMSGKKKKLLRGVLV